MTEQAGYKVVIVSPDEPVGEYLLSLPLVRIGRDSTQADLVLAHNWVSRGHARIYCDREPYRVEDVGSSNGTLLNELPLRPNEPRALKPGDVVAIGPFRLTFEAVLRGTEPAAPTAESMGPGPAAPALSGQDQAPTEEPYDSAAAGMAILERLATRRASQDQGPSQPDGPPEIPALLESSDTFEPWVGVPAQSSRWLQYLPPMYGDSEFLGRYLLLFEDMIGPIQQTIAHWDLFLNPETAPEAFLPWLNHWMAHLVDEHWSTATQRELLRNASWLHQARGTPRGLITHLQIVTGCDVTIEENVDGPHTFRVTVVAEGREVDPRIIDRIVDLNRPAHTTYSVLIK